MQHREVERFLNRSPLEQPNGDTKPGLGGADAQQPARCPTHSEAHLGIATAEGLLREDLDAE
jgi:hypothetical protein